MWILILTTVEVRFNALLHYSRTDMPSRIPRPWSPACGLHLLGSIAPGYAACRDGGGGQAEMITAAKKNHPLCSKTRDRGRAESQNSLYWGLGTLRATNCSDGKTGEKGIIGQPAPCLAHLVSCPETV